MERGEGWSVEFYRDERGRSPVQEFIGELDSKMQLKVARAVNLLEAFGDQLGMPLARPVSGQRFWELRIQTGGNIVRVFYFLFSGRRIVLLHGFVKKDQRTPRVELQAAARRRDEFLGRVP